jgi:hypothetical protein
MKYHQKYLSLCFLVIAALLSAASFDTALAQTAPPLGAASTFTLLSAAPAGGGAVSCNGAAVIGDVGSSGLAASVVKVAPCTITGAIIAPVSAQVLTGFNSAYDALGPLGTLDPCTGSLNTAYTDATLTLTPGVYCNAADVTFTRTTLVLDAQNNPNAVWIFKIGTDSSSAAADALTGTSLSVVMAKGGLSCNVYWWVDEAATLTDSNFQGTILAGAAITVTRGAFNGNALAKAAVTINGPGSVAGCATLTGAPPPSCKDRDDLERDHEGDREDGDHHDRDGGEKGGHGDKD